MSSPGLGGGDRPKHSPSMFGHLASTFSLRKSRSMFVVNNLGNLVSPGSTGLSCCSPVRCSFCEHLSNQTLEIQVSYWYYVNVLHSIHCSCDSVIKPNCLDLSHAHTRT